VFDLTNFICTPIPRQGFEWVSLRPVGRNLEIENTSEEFLVDPWILNPELNLDVDFQEARPFDDTVTVFSRFASVDMQKDSIAGFANEHGNLGIKTWGAAKRCHNLRMTAPKGESLETCWDWRTAALWRPFKERAIKAGILYGDPLSVWLDDLKAMQVCVRLFRALLAGDNSAIDPMFGSLDSLVHYSRDYPEKRYLTNRPEARAASLIVDLVNERVEGSCHTLLDTHGPSFSFLMAPKSFRGAIWCELAHATQGMKNFRECKTCRHLFCIGEGGSRKSRNYCSNKCRMKALRERKSKARDLHAGGMDHRRIAKEVGVKLETVKAWVKGVPKP
jgi:hypothetical protein